MNLLHKRLVFDFVSRHLVCRVPLRERRVALTFDDGPSATLTPRLLALLDRYKALATFFLIGRNVEREPALAADIVARGHEIGNHTHNHLLLPLLPPSVLRREIESASQAIHSATGRRPSLFRPPMGWYNRRTLRTLEEHGYLPVLGDVYPQDCARPGVGVLIERVMARVRPGSIIILHDGSSGRTADRSQAVDALQTILPRLHQARYAVGTVSALLAAFERETADLSGDHRVAATPRPLRSAPRVPWPAPAAGDDSE